MFHHCCIRKERRRKCWDQLKDPLKVGSPTITMIIKRITMKRSLHKFYMRAKRTRSDSESSVIAENRNLLENLVQSSTSDLFEYTVDNFC